MNEALKRVVVVDPNAQKIIPGWLMEGTSALVVPGATKRAVATVKKDPDAKNVDEYPDIIVTSENLVFDADKFYTLDIPAENYVETKYAVDDYIVGFSNTECQDINGVPTSFRLVGGSVIDISISVTHAGDNTYSYSIQYLIQMDVCYSPEQCWYDGLAPDCTYKVEGDDYIATVDEKLTITFIENKIFYGAYKNGGLSISDDSTLFYIMATVLLRAQLGNLNEVNMTKILNGILKSSCARLTKTDGAVSKKYLARYESPLRLMVTSIFAAICAVLDPNITPKNIRCMNEPSIQYILMSDDIVCDEIGTIPWNNIRDMIDITNLTNPDFCGIKQEFFADMMEQYVTYVNTDPDNRNGHLDDLVLRLQRSMSCPIRVGTEVFIKRYSRVYTVPERFSGTLTEREASVLKEIPTEIVDRFVSTSACFQVLAEVSQDGSLFLIEEVEGNRLDPTLGKRQVIVSFNHLRNSDKYIRKTNERLFRKTS